MRILALALGLFLCALSPALADGLFPRGVKALLVDKNGDGLRELVNLPYDHKRIHEGHHFFWTNSSTLGSGEYIGVLFLTNSTLPAHMTIRASGTGAGAFYLYEDVTNGTSSVIETGRNRERNQKDSSKTVHWLRSSSNILTSGTLIYTENFGSGKQAGGEARGANEIVLKKNTAYFFNCTSTSVGNLMTLFLDWYEHDHAD